MAERTIQVIFSNPYPGRDEEYNEWYDSTHVPEVLAIPGIVFVQRYDLRQLRREKEAGTEPEFRYLAIYEIEGDSDEVMVKLGAAVRNGDVVMNDSFDRTAAKLSFWAPHGPKTESR